MQPLVSPHNRFRGKQFLALVTLEGFGMDEFMPRKIICVVKQLVANIATIGFHADVGTTMPEVLRFGCKAPFA